MDRRDLIKHQLETGYALGLHGGNFPLLAPGRCAPRPLPDQQRKSLSRRMANANF
jgi:hypothetical protein